jgi:elongation factor G
MAPPLISLDITPKTPADQEKLARALQVLAAEDTELRVSPGVERSCVVIGAISEAHLEGIVDRLKREFEVEASVGRPAVAYLESLTRAAEGSAKHVGIALGQGEYAHVSLRVHPGEAGSGYRFDDATIGGSIPKPFMSSIDIGIRESMANGVLRGYPIVDVRVEVYDGSYHDTDSSDAAFQTAAALAFQQAAKNAEPVVLEPVMQVVVRTDDSYAKSVIDGLRMRRGEIQARMHEPDQDVITARVPLAELFGFEAQLRAETYGHGSCSIRFADYQPVVQGPAGDDDHTSRVGAPRRPAPNLRSSAASVPEPDDTNAEA